jgi:hypothetical protein
MSKRSTKQMNDEMPLRCQVVDGVIHMNIGVNVLRFAAEHHPYFWDGERGADEPNIKITDAHVFAKEVAHAINDEDGGTLLTRMLDKAIARAIEGGREGVDHEA